MMSDEREGPVMSLSFKFETRDVTFAQSIADRNV